MSLSLDYSFTVAKLVKKSHSLSSEDLTSHISVLQRYALSLTHNSHDADDLVQDCLVRALSRKDLFIPGTNMRAWLKTILHNIFLDSMRKARRSREFATSFTIMNEESVTRPNQLDRIELFEIDKVLAKLPAEQRSTLLLTSIEGLNYSETAEATGALIGTVRSRLSRARSALAIMMSADNFNNTTKNSSKTKRHPHHFESGVS